MGREHVHHDDCDPQRRTEAFHHHVGWNFCQHVEREKDGKSCVVLKRLRWHLQISLQAKQSRITDVCTVQEGKSRRD